MPKSKKAAKKRAATASPAAKSAGTTNGEPAPKPILRAIRVTPEVLDAAKSYKKERGVSFYRLGLEAITEVLKREGYLKDADA